MKGWRGRVGSHLVILLEYELTGVVQGEIVLLVGGDVVERRSSAFATLFIGLVTARTVCDVTAGIKDIMHTMQLGVF